MHQYKDEEYDVCGLDVEVCPSSPGANLPKYFPLYVTVVEPAGSTGSPSACYIRWCNRHCARAAGAATREWRGTC